MHTYSRATGNITVRIHVNADWSGDATVVEELSRAPEVARSQTTIRATDLVRGMINDARDPYALSPRVWLIAVSLAARENTLAVRTEPLRCWHCGAAVLEGMATIAAARSAQTPTRTVIADEDLEVLAGIWLDSKMALLKADRSSGATPVARLPSVGYLDRRVALIARLYKDACGRDISQSGAGY